MSAIVLASAWVQKKGFPIMGTKKTGDYQGFASKITLKNGRVLKAQDYGYKAFPIGFKNKKKKPK